MKSFFISPKSPRPGPAIPFSYTQAMTALQQKNSQMLKKQEELLQENQDIKERYDQLLTQHSCLQTYCQTQYEKQLKQDNTQQLQSLLDKKEQECEEYKNTIEYMIAKYEGEMQQIQQSYQKKIQKLEDIIQNMKNRGQQQVEYIAYQKLKQQDIEQRVRTITESQLINDAEVYQNQTQNNLTYNQQNQQNNQNQNNLNQNSPQQIQIKVTTENTNSIDDIKSRFQQSFQQKFLTQELTLKPSKSQNQLKKLEIQTEDSNELSQYLRPIDSSRSQQIKRRQEILNAMQQQL